MSIFLIMSCFCLKANSRPYNCRHFTYTDEPEFWTRLIDMAQLCSICPVVSERLKDIYGEEFGEYKKEYPENWI